MAVVKLLLSLGLAVMMCAWVRSEDWMVVCHNDTIVKNFNLSLKFHTTNVTYACRLTNYTCDKSTDTTIQSGVYIYNCTLRKYFSRDSSCFPANQSHSCVANVTLENNNFIPCPSEDMVQIWPLGYTAHCTENSTCPDNVTCSENVTYLLNVMSAVNGSTHTVITSEDIAKPTERVILEEDDVNIKITLGIILPVCFIAAILFIVVCLHKKHNLFKFLRNFQKKHRMEIPKHQASTQDALPDLSQYNSLNPVHHIVGQDNYSYATLTGEKNVTQTVDLTQENGVPHHPVISKGISTERYEYIPCIVGHGEGQFTEVGGRDAVANGSIRSDYTYELVTKATAGRERPDSPISCIYSKVSTDSAYYSETKESYSEL